MNSGEKEVDKIEVNNSESNNIEANKIETKQNKNNDGRILIKKTTFNGLIISLVAASLIAAFFAGSYSNLKSNEVTKTELNDFIGKLESKILTNQAVNQPEIKPIKISTDDDPTSGNQDAPITIVEFSDFQCPFCSRFYAQTLPLIREQYIDTGKVKFVYRDFPIQGSHPNALPAASASECAHEQGKYWEFHDMLFQNQNVWNKLELSLANEAFKEYARDLGLNENQFNSCLESGKYLEEIQKDLREGNNYGITGTPGFFIGNEKLGFVKLIGAQPFEAFKSIIETQLNT